MSLDQLKTTCESIDDYKYDYSYSTSSTRHSIASQNHSFNRNRSKWGSGTVLQKKNEWINNIGADSIARSLKFD